MPVPPDSPIADRPAPPALSCDLPSLARFRGRVRSLASLEKAVWSKAGRNATAQLADIDSRPVPWPCGAWRWLNRATGEIRPYRCRRWTCPFCAPVLVDKWAKQILMAPIRRHVTLTALGPTNVEATRRIQSIIKAIRRGEALGPKRSGHRRHPVPFEYFATLEATATAGIHAHLLQHGRSLPQRHLSSLAKRYGGGAVVWVRSLTDDEIPERVVEYVVEHLVGVVHPDQEKIGHRIRYSRNFWEGARRADIADLLWPPSDEPADWTILLTPEDQAIQQAITDRRQIRLLRGRPFRPDTPGRTTRLIPEPL